MADLMTHAGCPLRAEMLVEVCEICGAPDWGGALCRDAQERVRRETEHKTEKRPAPPEA